MSTLKMMLLKFDGFGLKNEEQALAEMILTTGVFNNVYRFSTLDTDVESWEEDFSGPALCFFTTIVKIFKEADME
ncbi:hypothetical protein V7O62_09015 [Methanolobus sp. ZRKC2]|uniref:hypothetical protein n=1 Tax=Methanolobus sp. ZRKC2 TaxID=3125783 RepID=UPI003245FA57